MHKDPLTWALGFLAMVLILGTPVVAVTMVVRWVFRPGQHRR